VRNRHDRAVAPHLEASRPEIRWRCACYASGKTVSTPKGNGDDKATTELAPIEIEALLHDESTGPIEPTAETIEMVPLVAIEDLDPPEPARTARGTTPRSAEASAVTPARPPEVGATVRMRPLTAEPSRAARGTDPVTPADASTRPPDADPRRVARGSTPGRPPRTVERLAIADIIKRK